MRKSPASQSNTILKYFSRNSPSSPAAANGGSPVSTKKQTPKSSTPLAAKNRSHDTNTTPTHLKGLNVLKNRQTSNNNNNEDNFKTPKICKNMGGYQLFDLVWAKLDGYPWWPSIICDDPVKKTFQAGGKIHVQFFDDPISHAWILKRDIKAYTGSIQPGTPVSIRDPKLKSAIESAEDALNVDREDRYKLIGNLNSDEYEASKSNEQSLVSESMETNCSDDENQDFITPSKRKKNHSFDEKDDSDNDDIKPKRKDRKRFKRICVDEESEDEYKPTEKEHSSSEESISEVESEQFDSEPSEDDEGGDVKLIKYKGSNKKQQPNKKVNLNVSNRSTPSKISSNLNVSNRSTPSKGSNLNESSQATTADNAVGREWPHLSYSFLKPQNIADSSRRKMLIGDGEFNPQYDPSTLYVPDHFLQQQTPAMRQWWHFKIQNFDTILFFKMGKFYELFHMDAVIAAKDLQILFMRGENAHAGFPEKSYKRYADGLIQKGYKVARIEQTETPAMMEERIKSTSKKVTKFDRVVRRELCRISSIGTRYLSDIDSDGFIDTSSYLFAFSCKPITELTFEFGLCFIDISIGKFYLSQFKDDQYYSKLRTLIAHYCPVELIIERSAKLLDILDTICPSVPKQIFRKFWPSDKTLQYVSDKKIWSNVSEEFKNKILNNSDLSKSCAPEYELAVNSLGGIVEYLEKSLIADDILSMNLFELYSPHSGITTSLPEHLILDSLTIKNLEVIANSKDSQTVSLFKIIDNCTTSFGKRMLRNWLCLPLCNQREKLEQRQEAVRELAENLNIVPEIKGWTVVLKKLPDLERLLTQIHSQGSAKRSKDHPDSRAILFDGHIYRHRRINNFLNTLDGFEQAIELMESISSTNDIKSRLFKKLVSTEENGGIFPDIKPKIVFFRNSFNSEKARKEANIIPSKGVDDEFDEANQEIIDVKQKLEDYLIQQRRFFGSRVAYSDSGKNRYQLEVPDSHMMKAVNCTTETYELKTARKGFKRYHTSTIVDLVAELDQAEAKRSLALSDILRRLLEKFDHDYKQWSRAIQCLAQLDALISLSKTKQIFQTNGGDACLSEFVWSSESETKPLLRMDNLQNACLIGNRNLISNNIELNNETLVLTGPNMAGKTTLMRSVGLATILAQIGAYLPASKCTMTPVDRIFTRIGAYDHVIESQSTFMIELNEAAVINRYATGNSLVLIDELGRGTSTFDGIAIAYAFLDEITQSINCRTMFSTHFHSIVEELSHLPTIKVSHMAYMVENENKEDPTEEDIIFLYKLEQGICSKSYGYNVAKLAGFPRDILRNAYKYGQEFETQVEGSRLLQQHIQSRIDSARYPPLEDDKLNELAKYMNQMLIAESRDV